MNCRIVPGHSTEEIRQELEKVVADPKISVHEVGAIGGVTNRKSFAPPPLRPDVFQPLEKVVESMWPGLPVIPDMATGASDGVYTNAAGLPTFRPSRDQSCGGVDESARVVNEASMACAAALGSEAGRLTAVRIAVSRLARRMPPNRVV